MREKIGASQVGALLKTKHKDDFYIEEITANERTGGRLDAFAIKQTLSPVSTIGYEIKVSRSDFLRDNKWQSYLGVCNYFYFVCPKGVVEPEELPDGIGLLIVSKNAKRLVTKRKAARRDTEDMKKFFARILLYRNGKNAGTEDKAKYWQEWLKMKDETAQLGRAVGAKKAALWRKLERHNHDLIYANTQYDKIKLMLKELGFNPERPPTEFAIRRKLMELDGRVTEGDKLSLRRTAEHITTFLESLEEDNKKSEKVPTPTPTGNMTLSKAKDLMGYGRPKQHERKRSKTEKRKRA